MKSVLTTFLAFAAPWSMASSMLLAEAPVTQWAPAEALLFVGSPDCDRVVEDFKKTNDYKSMQDPAIKETLQPWKKFYENARNVISRRVGLESPKELEIRPHGGFAFFVMTEPKSGENEEEVNHLCAVAEMGADAPRAEALAGKVVQLCLEKGAKKQVTETGGIEITTIQFPKNETEDGDGGEFSEEHGEDSELFEGIETTSPEFMILQSVLADLEAPEEFAFAFADDRLVLGSDTATVKDTLVRLRRDGEGSLGSLADLKSFHNRIDGRMDVLGAVNFPGIAKVISAGDEENQAIVEALRLDALGVLAVAVDFVPSEEIQSRVTGFLPVKRGEGGLGELLRMENIQTLPRETVPADTAFYVSMNLNPAKILDEVIAITRRINPENADVMQASLTIPQEDGSVLDVKADVIGKLEGPLTVALTLAQPFDAEHINLIVHLGHKSRDAIARLYGMIPPGMLVSTEILGHTIYELPMLPGAASGYTDRALVPFATRRGLENYIRSEGEKGRGLAEQPSFRKLLRHVPRESTCVLYTNGPLTMEAQIALAEERAGGEAGPPQFESFSAMLRQFLAMESTQYDAEVLKAMKKYEGNAIMTVRTEPDGIRLDMVEISADADAP